MSTASGAIPNLLIPYGPRSLLSLGGIAFIINGVWSADRSWDEKGSEIYQKAKSKGEKPSDEELETAFPFPWKFLLGWTLFGASYLFPIDGGKQMKSTISTTPTIVSIAACASLAYVASIPMADAVIHRNASKKQALSMAFVGSWLSLTFATAKELSMKHLGMRFAGMTSIIASMKILWKHRKMGDTWESEGKPNPNPRVYNFGGPLFITGWFLYWLGMAATDNADVIAKGNGIPFYFNTRSFLTFLSGVGMVPVVMFVDCAHDEGAKWLGFGTDGSYYGRFLESPIPFLSSWLTFGISSWFQASSTKQTNANIVALDKLSPLQVLVAANCAIQGYVAGIKIQNALYRGDMDGKMKWSLPFVGLFAALATEIGMGNGWYMLSIPGAILIVAGQKTVFGDRKRGDYWMQNNKKNNPNPIVYSWGEPLFTTGWIMFSTAMAIPFTKTGTKFTE